MSPTPFACPDNRKPAAPAALPDLMARALAGERAALGRLISLIENDAVDLDLLVPAIHAKPPRARVIGVTGPPGAGKSTFVGAILRQFLDDGQRVAVIAVDPSSPITHGAVLGDRIRMAGSAPSDRAFIRSLAARGQLGGLSGRTGLVVDLMDAAGHDTIIVETVGVGQSEIAIAVLAQTTLLLLAPGLGDDIQSLKAGILEIADLFVVNKSDLPGADVLTDHLRAMPPVPGRANPTPVVLCSATGGDGIDGVIGILRGLPAPDAAAQDARAGRLTALLAEIAMARIAARLDAAVPQAARYAAKVASGMLKLDKGVNLLLKDLLSAAD